MGSSCDVMMVRKRFVERGKIQKKKNAAFKSKGHKNVRCWNCQENDHLHKDCKF